MNVFIINHCSTNKGDKAVLEFILQELATSRVHQITVSANEPKHCLDVETLKSLQVKFVPWGWNIENKIEAGFLSRFAQKIKYKFYQHSYGVIRSCLLNGSRPRFLSFYCNSAFYRALYSADIVISTGGHHITSILAPNAVSPQTFEMALALLAGKPLYLWSQSIGPLIFSDEENRLFITHILSKSDAIYVRDKHSIVELEQLGIPKINIRRTYESVLGFGGNLSTLDKPSDRLPVVGISIYSVQARSIDENSRYINALRVAINHITASGYRVKFFPMQLQGEPADDRPYIQAIINSLQEPDQCSVYAGANSMLEHIKEVAKCRFFIGHKTHSVIIALVTGTPVLAIAYHPKTLDFMTQFELEENCVDDRYLEGSQLIKIFDRISTHMDIIGVKQLTKSAQFGELVRRDFNKMLYKEPICSLS